MWLYRLEVTAVRRSVLPVSNVSARVTRPPTTATAAVISPLPCQCVVYDCAVCKIRRVTLRSRARA